MRTILLISVLVLLGGCSALVRQDGDYFSAAGGSVSRFEMDDQACTVVADDYVAYDLRGMSGTSYDRNRSFNAVYARCMTGRGHAPHPYAENWLPSG